MGVIAWKFPWVFAVVALLVTAGLVLPGLPDSQPAAAQTLQARLVLVGLAADSGASSAPTSSPTLAPSPAPTAPVPLPTAVVEPTPYYYDPYYYP